MEWKEVDTRVTHTAFSITPGEFPNPLCVATTLASPHGLGSLVAMTAPPVLLNIPGRGHIPVRRAARGHRQPCFIKVSAPPPSPHTR
ncbi:hypothetical protein Pcinc_020256 [Petrolisthes cinctipes]|uniref:Uncharacterized protein n=1 Tax=Petrolisthes cinctipes TaxID=88211 RepID=A0AAE1FJQ6_PETCI|nr:hypothetical protein Pcinc_020256 [Petrolisthes cinctipes]